MHAFLLWAGDILMLYALLGSTMPWFARKTDRELLRWCLLGWGVGRPANLIAARALGHWPYLPPSPGGLIGVLAQAVGVPMLAIGYAATVGPSDAGS